MSKNTNNACLFCKIIDGAIPCHKILDTPNFIGFLDINPLSRAHALVIPKWHGAKLHEYPQGGLDGLGDALRRVSVALTKIPAGLDDYNILQNNGRLAHQEVDHVHFHIIPKSEEAGLGVVWKSRQLGDEAASLAAVVKEQVDLTK